MTTPIPLTSTDAFDDGGQSLLSLSVPQQAFLDNYYGAVTTTLPARGS